MQNYKLKYLTGGTIFVSTTPCIISTVLGSCVAVILWDSENKYGGMNHFLLPIKPYKAEDMYSYGDTSTKVLIDRMIKSGSKYENIKAMIYGGANYRSSYNIWSDNIKVAEEILKVSSVTIYNKNVGGSFGRSLKFNTFTGVAKHRFVDNLEEHTELKDTVVCQFPK